MREARGLLAVERRWRAFVVDIGLADGCGLVLLAEARAVCPDASAMVLTGHTTGDEINAAYDLGAQYVVKPIDASRMDQFLRAASARAPAFRVPCPSEAGRVPGTLSDCIEYLRALFAAPQDARARYAIGAAVAAIKARADLFGSGAVAMAAEALDEDLPSLYRHAAVAERLDPAEVDSLLCRTGPGRQSLTWSHLVVLGSVPSQAEREQLVNRVLVEGLSVRELMAVVAKAGLS
jgi:hypothetical protein